ncbi:MAG TPA: FkbM family methyltransferase [Stellaceae bacterium]|nr:FkbM family methyltransferase [Stellaceae bacterium]
MLNSEEVTKFGRSQTGFVSFGRYVEIDLSFFVDNEKDEIQKHHARGAFYELVELERIRDSTDSNMSILDIGANIGNHTLYFAVAMHAANVVPIEPNPSAYENLITNVRLNRLTNVDLSFLGIALGARDGRVALYVPGDNLGAGRILRDTDGDIEMTSADKLLSARHFDFIKIDVEGLELDVLSGIEQILAASRPRLYVEVNNANSERFEQWRERENYAVGWTYQRYKSNCNFFLYPR